MRLIDADALYDRLQSLANDDWNQGVSTTWAEAYGEVAEMVEDTQTVDVVPVRHGKWIIRDNPGTGCYRVTCSECGEDVTALRDFAVFVGWSIFDDELDGFFCEVACRKLYKLGIVSKNEENWAAGPEIIEKSREMGAEDIPMEYFEAGGK